MTMIISGSTGLEFPDGSDQTTAFTSNSPTFTGTVAVEALTASGNVNCDSGTLFVDSVNNRVGIGTTSPSALLQVSKALSSTLTSGINIQNYGTFTWGVGIDNAVSNTSLAFQSSGMGGTTRMVITSGGYVGIGTSSPSTTLHVTNADLTSPLLIGSQSDSATWGGFFVNGATSSTGGAGMYGKAGANLYFNSATGYGHVWTINGTERMRINSAGDVGIGTANPTSPYNARLAVVAPASQAAISLDVASGTNTAINWYNNGTIKWTSQVLTTSEFRFYDFTAAAERLRLDNSGNLLFNSGYGSVATAYGCRVWVNWNGQGTPTIRGSGGASSITDNGTGDYTVNFSITLPDTNYCALVTNDHDDGSGSNQQAFVLTSSNSSYANKSTTAIRVQCYNTTSADFDPYGLNLAVFR